MRIPGPTTTLEYAAASGARADRPHLRPLAGAQASVLESRYPGVVRALTLMWGYPELSEFLHRVANGLDARFRHIEPAALAELMLLGEVHRSICPPRAPATPAPALDRPAHAHRPALYRG